MCSFGSSQLVSSSVPALINVRSGITVASVVKKQDREAVDTITVRIAAAGVHAPRKRELDPAFLARPPASCLSLAAPRIAHQERLLRSDEQLEGRGCHSKSR
jgi:hypothetical protein